MVEYCDPRLNLIYFMTMTNVFLNVLIWGKPLKMRFSINGEANAMILDILLVTTKSHYLPFSQGSPYWIASIFFSEIRGPIDVKFHKEHALD